MNDPVRLLEVGASEFEADLLRAGRSDAMSGHSRKQILAGIGIGGLLTASTVASGVRAAAKGWLATVGVGVASVVAIWAGIHTSETNLAAPKPRVPPVAVVPRVTPAPEPVLVPAEPEPAPALAPAKPAARSGTASDGSLTAELAAVEQARSAFLKHDYGQTLRLLDDYSRRFPKRQLASEATVLRIEALAARGDRDSASRIGRSFLQNHPNGPYAQRVKSVIGDAGAHAP
jgi:hypothetical protein